MNEKTKELGDVISGDEFDQLCTDGFDIEMKLGLEEPLATVCAEGSSHFEEFKGKPNYIQKEVKYN